MASVTTTTPPGTAAAALRSAAGLASLLGRATIRRLEFIEADYSDGVLRPKQPLRLRPGERVGIMIVRRPDARRWNLERLARTPAKGEDELTAEGLEAWSEMLDEEDRR